MADLALFFHRALSDVLQPARSMSHCSAGTLPLRGSLRSPCRLRCAPLGARSARTIVQGSRLGLRGSLSVRCAWRCLAGGRRSLARGSFASGGASWLLSRFSGLLCASSWSVSLRPLGRLSPASGSSPARSSSSSRPSSLGSSSSGSLAPSASGLALCAPAPWASARSCLGLSGRSSSSSASASARPCGFPGLGRPSSCARSASSLGPTLSQRLSLGHPLRASPAYRAPFFEEKSAGVSRPHPATPVENRRSPWPMPAPVSSVSSRRRPAPPRQCFPFSAARPVWPAVDFSLETRPHRPAVLSTSGPPHRGCAPRHPTLPLPLTPSPSLRAPQLATVHPTSVDRTALSSQDTQVPPRERPPPPPSHYAVLCMGLGRRSARPMVHKRIVQPCSHMALPTLIVANCPSLLPPLSSTTCSFIPPPGARCPRGAGLHLSPIPPTLLSPFSLPASRPGWRSCSHP